MADLSTIPLRLCPSCGGPGTLLEQSPYFRVRCKNFMTTCTARFQTPPRSTPLDAANVWNTRAYDQAVTQLQAKLTAATSTLTWIEEHAISTGLGEIGQEARKTLETLARPLDMTPATADALGE